MKQRHTAPVITAALLALLSGCASLAPDAAMPVAPPSTNVVLQTDQTVLGQPIVYPSGSPDEVTAAIVTLEPGARTGWHRHPVPLVAYMLEGELTVAYQDHGERVYRAGDALVEAIETPHEGHNSGDAAARLLVVFIGAEGTPNTTPIE